MPRKQYDILRDLFKAHKESDETAYRDTAKEYIRYLRWKKHNNIADEYETIFFNKNDTIMKKSKTGELTLPLFEQKPKVEKKAKLEKPVWQVSNGIEINLMQTQRLLAELIAQGKLSYSKEQVSTILGYAPKKTDGFVRPLYFMGLIENNTRRPTNLSKIIQKYDPYFEDTGTLWFLHFRIASQKLYIIWNRIVRVLMHNSYFSLEKAYDALADQKSNYSEYSFHHHLRREFRVITNAYVQSEFRKLNILEKDKDDRFKRIRPASIPDNVVYAIILYFKEMFFRNDVTMEINNLLQHENAPARLLFMSEDMFRQTIERLRMEGLVTIESFADLDQIKFNQRQTWIEALETYYKQKYGLE